MRRLARRLLAVEAATPPPPSAESTDGETRQHEAVRVCDKLCISLTRFAGADGFASLLRRTLALARAEVPALSRVTITPGCTVDGLEALAARDPEGGAEAATAIIANLLSLLVTFIGEPLTLRLVREAWPPPTNLSLDEVSKNRETA